MNKRDKENLLETREKEITKKQKRIRSCNKTYVRNNFFVLINIYVI